MGVIWNHSETIWIFIIQYNEYCEAESFDEVVWYQGYFHVRGLSDA